MLIDGQKWACEACIRGHRVTSCKHHDRPLIRIKRKGRPFALCTLCNATPCIAPVEHARAKRDAELKSPSKKSSHGRLYPRHHNSNGFLPIAPRPGPGPGTGSVSGKTGLAAGPGPGQKSRSGSKSTSASVRPSRSTSAASSVGKIPVHHDGVGVGDWSGSDGGISERESFRRTASSSVTEMPGLGLSSSQTLGVTRDCSVSRSAPGSLYEYPVVSEADAAALFDPAYSLLPSTTAVSGSLLAQTLPMVSPLDEVNPFEFPLVPAMELDDGSLSYLNNVDLSMDLDLLAVEDVFQVEDWSRYMWSAETGFEHLDTGYPPVSQ